MDTDVLSLEPTRTASPLPELDRAVLLTVLYGDLFDYPLRDAELRRWLLVPAADSEIDAAVERLLTTRLERVDGFLCLRGRASTVALRRRRGRLAAGRWRSARRFGRWLAAVPFLRMVAVCGSQAVENGDADGDLDLFLITEPGRLWIVQALVMTLRRPGRRLLEVEICPNYLLSGDRLEVVEKNLYTAREIAQAVPLWGRAAYRRFLEANGWIAAFLPRFEAAAVALTEPPRPLLTRMAEGFLDGALGDLADRFVHRALLLYYRWRLRDRGWGEEEIADAYRRDRQTVISGGYAGAVARRFHERADEVLGVDAPEPAEIRALFDGAVDPDPLFAELFEVRYRQASTDLAGGHQSDDLR